ncbi:RNA-directed DNA polymerase, eukaryota [Tanacetum coccineum]
MGISLGRLIGVRCSPESALIFVGDLIGASLRKHCSTKYRRSKVDDVLNISTSFFVTNFPEQTTAKELWRLCKQYGNVIDMLLLKRLVLGPSSVLNIQAAKVGIPSLSDAKDLKPALVLDDSCAHETDHTLSLVGKLKEFGLWVILQFSLKSSKDNFMLHVGVNSWFLKIQQASNSFIVDERVVWIDIEGVPLCAWSNNTFTIIASIWGSLLYDEDKNSPHFHRKRLCIKTSNQDIIFDSLKIIVKGKVFLYKVIEFYTMELVFNDSNEDASDSDEESVDKHAGNISHVSNEVHKEIREEEKSEDPFNIYDMFNKEKPAKSVNMSLDKEPGSKASFKEDVNVSGCSGHFQSVNVPKTGGSILQVIEDFIKVGQTMGYKMEGCMKDFEEIVNSQGACEFFK